MARKSCTSSPDLFTSFLAAPPKSEVLERLATLIAWEELRGRLENVYKFGGAGREPVDPVLLFKLLLLERLYQLSDRDVVWMARDSLNPDADFTVKNGKPHYGYKLHLGQDRETGLITHHVLTSASVHDSQVFADLVDGSEGEVLADKGYDSRAARALVRRRGAKPSIMRRAKRGQQLSPWWRGRNRSIARVRSFIEGANACLKRWRGCGRAIYRGMERVMMQMTMGVMAFNLTRAVALERGKCAL